jgi:two-component system, cell cycle response regulator
MLIEANPESRGKIFIVTKTYEYFLRVSGALIALLGIWYLQEYQSPQLCSVEHTFHNFAVFVAILIGSFVSIVTWRCYRFSGEPFLRWLSLGFIGFTIIYAPHGLFTSISESHMALFLLYGPASRLVMALLLFVGLLSYGRREDAQAERDDHQRWWRWAAFFFLIDIFIALVAETSLLKLVSWRIWMESGALIIAVVGVVIVLVRHRSSPLMMTYALSLSLFAQSSIAFLLAKPWNHQWWYAHILFAIGFFFLSYGVVRAFHTTGAFSTVFSVEELMSRLRTEKNNTEGALHQLQAANAELAWMASTDSLTGASNRRHFLDEIELELGRAKRNGLPVSLLALDIDHFKAVNDQYGHQAGDALLKAFVDAIKGTLRPHDMLGRVGGEEFMVLLPDTSHEAAAVLAERIRSRVESLAVAFDGTTLSVTVSVGVAEFGVDGDGPDAVFKAADTRMYQAKHEGRNRVIS